jgi:hypothetical protein
MRCTVFAVVCGCWLAVTVWCQLRTPAAYYEDTNNIPASPEILKDHRVTFRLFAPKASEVVLIGSPGILEVIKQPMPLQKDDRGVWSLTIGPLVESKYRVLVDRNHRAIGGLSMGAGQSMAIGLHNLDKFAYIAAFSGGGNREEWEKMDPAVLNQKLRVLWIGCGTEDPGYNGVKGMADMLAGKKVNVIWNESGGGHSWPNWQVYLSKYVPLLFRD